MTLKDEIEMIEQGILNEQEAEEVWYNAILDDSRSAEIGWEIVELIDKLPYGAEEIIPALMVAALHYSDLLSPGTGDWALQEAAEILEEGIDDGEED